MDIIGFIFSFLVFVLYIILWAVKRISLKNKIKKDINVFKNSTSPIQNYMLFFSNVLTIYAIIIVILHLLNIKFFVFFQRVDFLNSIKFDILGFVISLFGLSLCLYAQIKMGVSWRVGIDEKNKTELITDGIYKYIRNPTYLGLFMVCFGVLIILPTISILFFAYSFVIFLEIQTRCEEDFLEKEHGKKYIEYKNKTKRYIPFIY